MRSEVVNGGVGGINSSVEVIDGLVVESKSGGFSISFVLEGLLVMSK